MKLFKSSPSQLVSIIYVAFLIVFCTNCTNESNSALVEQTPSVLSETEVAPQESYKIYKLYKERSKGLHDQPVGLDMFEEFNKIYEAHDVKVIGVWQNTEDPNELYFMTAFRNNEHYKNFVISIRKDSSYLKMSAKIDEDRESIEVVTLNKVR